MNAKPGEIVAYNRRPRTKTEILCHNHILHHRHMTQGANGFRWFTARAGGDWRVCPCGCRPELGKHYAHKDHVKWWRDLHKRLRTQEAVDEYVWGLMP